MTKQELCKKYGLRKEIFKFYLELGAIIKLDKDDYEVDKKKFSKITIEKSSVFCYNFNDSWQEDLDLYKKNINNTGKVKVYSKKEIKKYAKKRGSCGKDR
jgi:hypothetical protein